MHRHLFVLAFALGAAAPVGGATGTWSAPPNLVRLEAPRAGETLRAGDTAELAWEPFSHLGALGQAEEWEAFLSFDGGATYPVRITPHLDLELRRVRWQVPAVPTDDARLLLRFGDERHETAVELPQRFAIAEAPWAAPLFGGSVRRAALPGEPALPGRPGVVAWVEGSRQGGDLRAVVVAPPPGLEGGVRTPSAGLRDSVLATVGAPVQLPARLFSSGIAVPHFPRNALAAAGAPSGLPSLDILLLTHRQNE
ncbi:MAG TPA: hypothetical protein VGS07_19840 [Thermoanaerobaculia bacterium]|jgi:hypothetical protein|nr:hypothetical protein [Thermoanaerobaculia bacterium]